MSIIRSRKHELYTEEVNKVALSADDDKRHVLQDGIHTVPLTYDGSWTLQFKKLIVDTGPPHPLLYRFAVIAMNNCKNENVLNSKFYVRTLTFI